MIKKLLFFGLLSYNFANLQAIISIGNSLDPATTFQFSIGSAIYNEPAQQLWTLSGQDLSEFSDSIQSYGISYTSFVPIDNSFNVNANVPLTSLPFLSTKAIVTTTDNNGELIIPSNPIDNPLFGKAYSSVTFVGKNLTVVSSLNPQYIYFIQSVYFDDGTGKTSPVGTSIINQLTLQAREQAKYIAGSGQGILFFAQAQGLFGTANSSIGFASSSMTSANVNGQNISLTGLTQQAYTPLTISSSVLTAEGGDLESIGSSITMYPSSIGLPQMYVGVDVTASSGENCQAVGLFLATAVQANNSNPALVNYSTVIPDTVASAGLQTPVSTYAGNKIVVSNVSVTTTSTGLSYIIVSSCDQTEQQSIYAMPMVTMASDSSQNGKIADFDSIKQTFQIIGTTYRVQGFDTTITDANQIDINGSTDVVTRLQIGGGPVPLAPGEFINQLAAQGDCVYITIQTPFGANSTPGMFASQALFDEKGRIIAWSPWQRVAGTDDQMIFAIKNRYTNSTMYVGGANSNAITQTTWNSSTDLTSLITAINNAMPLQNKGVQGLIAISNQTQNLNNFPMVIATGNQAVVIAQTGSLNSTGNMQIDNPQNTITINSQLGLEVGSVVTAAFAYNTLSNNNWFFMGGDNGLAVLSNDTTGVTFNGQLLSLASLIAAGMSCKTVGSFKFVKKIVGDSNFLYVLTPSAVYRIALDENKFLATNPTDLDAQIIVNAFTIDPLASCTDMLVDNNLMLLGTTAGLYSIDLASQIPATPVPIVIPGGLQTVSRMVTISNSPNFNQNFYDHSNLYILSINYALQQVRLNRFTITNGVVTPIQDQLLKGQNGPLVIFDYMSNNTFIDGSLGFTTSYRIGSTPPAIKYMQYTLQAGKSSTQILLRAHTSDLSIAAVISSLGITAIARDYASGCLMLAADFGLLTDS